MKQEDPLVRLIKYHENISEYLEAIKEILNFLCGQEAWVKIKPIEDFFQWNIIDHFEFEEKMIFPVCLLKATTPEIISLILELQREHGSILAKVEDFQRMKPEKKDDPLDKETISRLNVIGREIFDMLLAHASKEDDKLIPFLEENRQIFEL